MTETLARALHDEAGRARLAPVDLDAVVRAGDRVVRRRGLAASAVAVGCLATVAAGTVLPRHHDRAAPHPVDPSVAAPTSVTWAQGSVIHDGADSFNVGHRVVRYVRTSLGYVFTDADGTVWSWRDGVATRVGQTSGPLVADADGTVAGWVDPDVQQKRVLNFAFVDQASGRGESSQARTRSTLSLAPGYYADARVVAVDGDQAWWVDDGTAYRRDLSWSVSGASPPVGAGRSESPLDLPAGRTLLAATADVLVEQDRQTGEAFAVRAEGEVSLGKPADDLTLLSPDGRHVAFGTSEGRATLSVLDTLTGGATPLEAGAWSALATAWLGDDRVEVLVAETEESDYRLDVCTVSTASCAVAVDDLGSGPTTSGGNGLRFALPTGDVWFPYPHG